MDGPPDDDHPNDVTFFYVDLILLKWWDVINYCPSEKEEGWYWIFVQEDMKSIEYNPKGPFDSRKNAILNFLEVGENK